MICVNHFWEIKFVDLLLPTLTVIGLVVAYFQLIDIRQHKRIEFTYQLYRDFFNYLNDERNNDQRDWLFGKEVKHIDRNKIGDLLEQFEAVWSLQNQNLIESDIVYDLFAFYIFKAADAKSPSALEYIEQIRTEEKNLGDYADDLFIGYESLLKQMKSHKPITKKSRKKKIKHKK